MNSAQNSMLDFSANSFYGIDYVNQQFHIIDSITTEDILNTARNVFSGNPVYSISGTKEALEFNKDFLDSLKK
jgi:hypothetical protein